jgi:hypothetical protein
VGAETLAADEVPDVPHDGVKPRRVWVAPRHADADRVDRPAAISRDDWVFRIACQEHVRSYDRATMSDVQVMFK